MPESPDPEAPTVIESAPPSAVSDADTILEPAAQPKKRSRGRWLRELLLFAVLFIVVSTALGRLRAPELPPQAPDFTLQDLSGAPVSLQDFRGKTVVLNFWATWCTPCKLEIPMISSFAKAHPEVVVLGVAVDGKREALAKAAPALGIDYPVLVGTPQVVKAYGATTVPTTVIVDKDGGVRTAHVGLILTPQLWLLTRDAD